MIQVLLAVARVSETSAALANTLQGQLEAALGFALRNRTATLSVIAASERALRASFSQNGWDVLHLIAPLHVFPAAHYSTIDLESNTGAARSLSAEYMCNVLADSNIATIVLYSVDGQSSFDGLADDLAQKCNSTIITAHALSAKELTMFLAKLHVAIAEENIKQDFPVQLPGVKIWQKPLPLYATPNANPALTSAPVEVDNTPCLDVIKRKRELVQFDVFLCHNNLDKPAVRRMASRLEHAGILPWLDERELPPGMPWIPLLESQIQNIQSAAVFFGSAGIGPWQEEELGGFLRQFAKRHLPIIPILLPDAPLEPQLPMFLAGRSWVDFRSSDGQPFERLVWAITGKRPTCQ